MFGPLGLRAGWGIALYSTAACLLMLALFTLLSFVRAGSGPIRDAPTTAGRVAVSDGILLLATSGSAWLLARLERRRLAVYGLGSAHVRDVLPGALAGFLLLSCLVALLHALHLLTFERVLLHTPQALRNGLAWLVTFALVGLFEEYFFRGYLQYTFTRGLLGLGARLSPVNARAAAFWLAAVLLSLLFCLTHLSNQGETASGISAVFVAGLLFSYALWRTGSLWWGVGFHAAWDWAQSFLFGVPDSGNLSAGRLLATHPAGNPLLSGGAAGPEGSLLVLPTLLCVAALLRFIQPRTQPPLAPEPPSSERVPVSPLALR